MSFQSLAPGLVALLLSVPAGAEVVVVWSELSLRFSNLGGAEVSSTSTALSTLHGSSAASSHLSSLTLPAASLVASLPVSGSPGVVPITSVRVSMQQRPDIQGGGVIGNISGAIGGSGALTPATIPATGEVLFCQLLAPFPPCVAQLSLKLGTTWGGQWAGMGVGGFLTLGGTGSVRISVVGAPFTVRTVSAVARTANGGYELSTARGFAHGPLSQTSSTAQVSGVLQLVTATRTDFPSQEFDTDTMGMISHVLIHVIEAPEPRLPLTLASGAALLALLGYRRRRR